MDLNSPLFLTTTLSGLIFMLVAFYQRKYPPKKINDLYGYRTKGSKASQARWDFAQQYSAKLMLQLGALLFIVGGLGLVWDPGPLAGATISIFLLLLAVGVLYIRTERAMDQAFNDDIV